MYVATREEEERTSLRRSKRARTTARSPGLSSGPSSTHESGQSTNHHFEEAVEGGGGERGWRVERVVDGRGERARMSEWIFEVGRDECSPTFASTLKQFTPPHSPLVELMCVLSLASPRLRWEREPELTAVLRRLVPALVFVRSSEYPSRRPHLPSTPPTSL